jgi:CRP/FNR family transcriptional regulator, cyclic AMP receptor protein
MSKEMLETFAGHAFLRGLNRRHLTILASGAKPFQATEGEYLGREGQTAMHFYLIQVGKVSIEIRRQDAGLISVQALGPGEAVGWSWLVPPHLWQFDCRVIDKVRGIALDAEWLREQCEADTALGHQLLKRLVIVLAGRLATTRRLLADLDNHRSSEHRENGSGVTIYY